MKTIENARLVITGLGYVSVILVVELGRVYSNLGFNINGVCLVELNQCHYLTLKVSCEELDPASQLCYSNQLGHLKDRNLFIATIPTLIYDNKQQDLTF